MTKPRSSEAVEGDTVIILCEVVGDPKPEVIWLRDWLRVSTFLPARLTQIMFCVYILSAFIIGVAKSISRDRRSLARTYYARFEES